MGPQVQSHEQNSEKTAGAWVIDSSFFKQLLPVPGPRAVPMKGAEYQWANVAPEQGITQKSQSPREPLVPSAGSAPGSIEFVTELNEDVESVAHKPAAG